MTSHSTQEFATNWLNRVSKLPQQYFCKDFLQGDTPMLTQPQINNYKSLGFV